MKKILVFMIALIICLYTVEAISKVNLNEIETYILQEDYTQAITSLRKTLPFLSASELPRGQFLMGLSHLKLGQSEEARKYLTMALKGAKSKDLIEKIKLSLCDSYYLDEDFYKAASGYSSFLDEFQRSDYSHIVKFNLAKSYLKIGRWQEAKKLLKEVAKSASLEAESAKRILEEDQFYFTIQVGSFQDKKNAYNLLKKLKRDKFDCFITEIEVNGITFYRVRVGQLNTRAEAEGLAARLKQKDLPTKIYP